MLKVIATLGILSGLAVSAIAAEKVTLPELLTIAHARCQYSEFLRVASKFPLDLEKMAAIELAAKRLKRNSTEQTGELCQATTDLIEQRRALDVLAWHTPSAEIEWLEFIIKALEQQSTFNLDNIVSEVERMENCPNAGADGRISIRGIVENCGAYSPTSDGFLWCADWRTIGAKRRSAQLKAMKAPSEVSEPVSRMNEADMKCYKRARADGAGGWNPAYECPEADNLRPAADKVYQSYVATHHLPWKSQKEECTALKPLM